MENARNSQSVEVSQHDSVAVLEEGVASRGSATKSVQLGNPIATPSESTRTSVVASVVAEG